VNWPVRIASVTVAAALVVGCGGGGTTPSTPKASATSAPASVGSPSSKTPLGYATLKVKYTQGLLHAKLVASTTKKPAAVQRKGYAPKTTAAVRRPAYLNGNTSNYLDIWVVSPGFAYKAVDSTGSGGNVAPSEVDGTQSFSVPLYAGDQNDVVAVEYDGDPSLSPDLLAIGEADVGNFAGSEGSVGFGQGGPTPTPIPGSFPVIGLTMLMYVSQIGVMSDANNANTDATAYAVGSVGNSFGNSFGTAFYLFGADATGAFLSPNNNGVGGSMVPSVLSWVSDVQAPANTLEPDPNGIGVNSVGYSVSFNNSNGGVTVQVGGNNPAAAILVDAENNAGLYPGIDYIYKENDLPSSIPFIPLTTGGSTPAPINNTTTLQPTQIDLGLNGG
jgi:hypothetical protein